MDKFKISMASVAVLAFAGCSENSNLFNTENNTVESVSIDDILNKANTVDENTTEVETRGNSATDTEIIKTNITSEPVSDEDVFVTTNVGYTLKSSSLPVCYNTEDVYLDYSNDNKTYTCKWICGIYQGDGPISVVLTFKKTGTWELDNEELSTTSSRCH